MEKRIIRRDLTENHLLGADIHPLLQKIFSARGVIDQQELDYSLQRLLPYHDLLGIDKATELLYLVLQKNQRILIVGDFDADGATSIAVATKALRSMGAAHVDYLVPNRFEYGYGLTPEIVEVAKSFSPDLIITVDNGISSVEGVAAANALGIQVLITDHHLPGNVLPDAACIINPNQPGDVFASKHLAGVGVIFYVMLALRTRLRDQGWFDEKAIMIPKLAELLDLVALGTVADVVKLDANNRILVQQGLQRIRSGKCCPGIQSLLSVAGRDNAHLIASDLGFALGPRLNAAGRLDDMSVGVSCLLANDLASAQPSALELDALNQERKTIEADMQSQAFEAINKLKLDNSLGEGVCLFDNQWHQGVVGLIASRIKEKLNRPVIAFAPVSQDELKGSARSISGLHIRDVLDRVATENPGLITKFGGHAMAAGLSLLPKNLTAFQHAFDKEVSAQLEHMPAFQTILSDGELQSTDLCMQMAQVLQTSTPWGQGFEAPVFDNVFTVLQQRLLKEKHLKLLLQHPDLDESFDAICFNVDTTKWPNHRCESVRLAYRLDVNHFRGRSTLQLMVEHIEVE